MLKLFLPAEHVRSVFEITPKDLADKGIKGIITDLDNTLVEWDRPEATPMLIEWFEQMKAHGISITVVSNNNEKRVKSFCEPLNLSFIYRAKKPMGNAFRQALKQMALQKQEVVVIGDQLLTDVFGGNRSRIHTILVVPVAQSDGFFTKFNRMVERRLLAFFRKKGMLHWEEQK